MSNCSFFLIKIFPNKILGLSSVFLVENWEWEFIWEKSANIFLNQNVDNIHIIFFQKENVFLKILRLWLFVKIGINIKFTKY